MYVNGGFLLFINSNQNNPPAEACPFAGGKEDKMVRIMWKNGKFDYVLKSLLVKLVKEGKVLAVVS